MEAVLRLGWDHADARDRVVYAITLGGLLVWMGYTRFFWPLRSIHATLPACPFLTVTGHPCPLCGGTRSYAAMWSGDVLAAARYHPLGPALFVLTVVSSMVLAAGAVSGRRLSISLPMRLETWLYLGVGAALAVSWTLKLLWLGN